MYPVFDFGAIIYVVVATLFSSIFYYFGKYQPAKKEREKDLGLPIFGVLLVIILVSAFSYFIGDLIHRIHDGESSALFKVSYSVAVQSLLYRIGHFFSNVIDGIEEQDSDDLSKKLVVSEARLADARQECDVWRRERDYEKQRRIKAELKLESDDSSSPSHQA